MIFFSIIFNFLFIFDVLFKDSLNLQDYERIEENAGIYLFLLRCKIKINFKINSLHEGSEKNNNKK